MTTTEHHYDYLISVLGRIREVTGVGHKTMLSELPEAIAQVISDLKAQPQASASAVECAREIDDYICANRDAWGNTVDREHVIALITAHTASAVAEAREKALEEYTRKVRDAYHEGFSEGMREHHTNNGGKTWDESNAFRALKGKAAEGGV